MTATVNSASVTGSLLGAPETRDDDLFATDAAPRHRGRRIVTLVTIVVLVAALAGVALSSTRASGAQYRVAMVTNADATAVLDGVATIEPVSQATVAFPISGTVANVAVKTGQKVTAGATLASVDTTSLYETIHTDEASLAQAKLTLADALDGTSTASTSGSGATGASTATLTAATTSYASPSNSSPSKSEIAAAQKAVVAAQAKVDRALASADAAVKAAETVCGPATAHPATTSTTAAASTTSTTTSSTTPVGSCTAALQTSLAAQQSVSVAQRSLDSAVQHLTTLLDAEASTPSSNSNTPSGSGTGQSTGTGTGSGAATGAQTSGGGATTKTASAADLEADQTSVDAATAKLAVGIQSLTQARITTPITGTVIAVNIAAGDTVSANSTTETIIVAGAKGYEVTTTVAVTQIARVVVGRSASVLPDGAASTITGHVSEISAVPSTSSSATTTYNVVVGLDRAPSTLQDGTTGSVSIITDAAKAALVVPSSAVHTSGKNHTVTVALGSSRTKAVPVTVGVQGATATQIKSGLAVGEHVVIADLNKALPSSATSSQSNSSTNRNGAGGFGGGTGGPPSGFTAPSR